MARERPQQDQAGQATQVQTRCWRAEIPRLKSKRALVTGAGSGIGHATAVRFAAEAARVAAVDIDGGALQRTCQEIERAGGASIPLTADVTSEQEISAAVAETVDRWGGLDVIVANAAVQLFGADGRADELELEVWERTMAVNLTGVFLTCKHGIRALLASGGGNVICTGSPTGLFGLAPGFDAYSASKAGVMGLARVMASDYANDGIRVNVVVPGFTETPLVRSVLQDENETARRLERIPLRRPGRPDEVAALMVYLASDESSYATGGIFFVDGGATAI
jgi:NAD(P)-dependent dehydrogenase (short-subunit alcohol dehydrogenase family)